MNKIQAAIKMKCPRCQEGEVFLNRNPYALKQLTAMHKHCPKCGLKYEREIGFFYGAMYVSYMFNIALFVIATVAYYLFFEERVDWLWYILGYLGLTFLLFPLIYRLSRSLWLQAFNKYEPGSATHKH